MQVKLELTRPLTGNVWVTCSREASYPVSRERHIVTTGWRKRQWVTTVCGASGNPGAWRNDSKKPMCPACVTEFNKGDG